MNNELQNALIDAVVELQKQVRAHHKMNVKKDYSLMVADAQATKAVMNARAAQPDGSKPASDGPSYDVRTKVLRAIIGAASVVDDNAQARLDVIQRLASWSPARSETLDSLLMEAASLAPGSCGKNTLRTFEITGAGFDASTSATDDRVFWVQASSAEEIQQAIAGTGAAFHATIDGDSDIDFRLPADLEPLRAALMSCSNPGFEAVGAQESAGQRLTKRTGVPTVAELKKRGFTVAPAADAVGCTEVRAAELFYHFNPKFLDDATDIVGALKPATSIGGGVFRLVIAGVFAELELVPLELVTEAESAEILGAHAVWEAEKAKRDAANVDVARAGVTLRELVFNAARKPILN